MPVTTKESARDILPSYFVEMVGQEIIRLLDLRVVYDKDKDVMMTQLSIRHIKPPKAARSLSYAFKVGNGGSLPYEALKKEAQKTARKFAGRIIFKRK